MSNKIHDIYVVGRPDINDIARKFMADSASDLLKEAVSNILVDENRLGAYFATIMTNPYAAKAAKAVKGTKAAKNVEDKDNEIEKMPKKIRPHLSQIKNLLEEQLQKRRFWKITATTLSEVGTEVIKIERIIMDKYGPIIRLI